MARKTSNPISVISVDKLNGTVKINDRLLSDPKETRNLGVMLIEIARTQREAGVIAKRQRAADRKAQRTTELAAKKAERDKKAATRKADRVAKLKAQQAKLAAKLAELERAA